MRLLTVLALAAIAALLSSQFQATAASPTRDVNVANTPLPVEIVNPPPGSLTPQAVVLFDGTPPPRGAGCEGGEREITSPAIDTSG